MLENTKFSFFQKCIVSLSSIGLGFIPSYISPTIYEISKKYIPGEVSKNQSDLFVSLPFIFSVIGIYASRYIKEEYFRKILICANIAVGFFWFLLYYLKGSNFNFGIAIRCVHGVFYGLLFSLLSSFLRKITYKDSKYTFIYILHVGISFGYVLCYTISSFFDYRVSAFIFGLLNMAFASLLAFVPTIKYSPDRGYCNFDSRTVAFSISLFLFQQLSGAQVILISAKSIIGQANTSIDPGILSGLVALPVFIVSLSGKIIIKNKNLKKRWITSSLGCSTALTLLYFRKSVTNYYTTTTFIGVLTLLISYSLGLSSIPYLMIIKLSTEGELFDSYNLCIIFNNIFIFFTLYFTNIISDANESRNILIFMSCTLVSAVYGLYFDLVNMKPDEEKHEEDVDMGAHFPTEELI